MGQTVRPPVQLSVGDALLPFIVIGDALLPFILIGQRFVLGGIGQAYGDGLGRMLNLGLKELSDGDILRIVRPSTVPVHGQLSHFCLCQQRQRGNGAIGVGDDLFQEALKVPEHLLDRCGIEKIRAVLDRYRQPVVLFQHRQGQVKLGQRTFGFQGGQGQAGQFQGGDRRVLEDEHDLEQR